jgi:ATP phosphoribosyltransferase regulatory subunit
MIDDRILKNDERAVYRLRSLYRKYGYMPFKMSKFEEYELYVRNKDFLVSDRIITFTDTSGKLLAMKPDVTLSIVKSRDDKKGSKQKVYYNENVYRVSGNTHQFKEIMQSGIECIGDLDSYDIYEVLLLAGKSLSEISENYVLDVSHLGILNALLCEAGGTEEFKREAAHYISEKNTHDMIRACERYGIASDVTAKIATLIATYGKPADVLPALKTVCTSADAASALDELCTLCELLSSTEVGEHLYVDFSLVNNLSYYNGIVLKGFVDGICEGVLTGGQYDNLMRRMGRSSRAIGFAVYLDLLEGLDGRREENDVDVLVLYKDGTAPTAIMNKVSEYTAQGLSVSAQRCIPEGLRYGKLLEL